ncbi:MAG: hypothetical protein U0S48_13505 [Solirubrobacteraceae bacterium]
MGFAMEIGAACAGVLLSGAGLAMLARRRAHQNRSVALGFLVPVPLVVALAALQGVLLGPLAALPMLTAGALSVAAAAVFWPTRASRFAEFERQFWAHVQRARAGVID